MTHVPPILGSWQGRVDADETGPSERWHQRVQPLSGTSEGGVTLVGFAVDEGVRRNSGRAGAAQGPQALRAALAGMPVLGEPALFDAGDVQSDEEGLEVAQEQFAAHVAAAIRRGSLPLGLGGGHEIAWGSFQGIKRARPTARLLVLNLDAHFDLRVATRPNSGTPFLQAQQWCASNGQSFDYRVLGISRFANTEALFERARSLQVRYWLDEELQEREGALEAQQALAADLRACDAVYLTVCLDVLPASLAPGVSAPAALGVPLVRIEAVIEQVMRSGKLVAADLAELNPSLDRDGITARVAARLAARIARGATHARSDQISSTQLSLQP